MYISKTSIYKRCIKFASALEKIGIGKGDTVSVLAFNTPEIFEAHYSIPMTGGVLNTINIRLDAKTIAYILEHSDAPLGEPYTTPKRESIFSALNICVTQPKSCILEHLSNGVVPFKPLEIYLFNNDEYHHAFNKSDENRFHIIAHAEYDYDFAELFVKSFEKYYEHTIK